MRRPARSLLLLPVLVAAAVLVSCAPPAVVRAPAAAADAPVVAVPTDAQAAQVVRDVDGDTIIAAVGGADVRVRLLGLDTPESVKPGTPVACFGHEASSFTTRLLPKGTRLRVAYEAEHTDAYGRQLWDLWLPDGRWVNGLLVASGAARAYPYRPNTTYATELAAAEVLAKAGRRGLWSACDPHAAFPQDANP